MHSVNVAAERINRFVGLHLCALYYQRRLCRSTWVGFSSPSVCLTVCLSIYLSVCLYVSLSFCGSVTQQRIKVNQSVLTWYKECPWDIFYTVSKTGHAYYAS